MLHPVIGLALSLILMAPPAEKTVALSKLRPAKHNMRWSGMPFGKDSNSLMSRINALVAQRFEQQYRETATDPHARDRLQEEIRIQIQAIRDSHIEFKGQKTGYTVSVVGEEFAHRAGESMLVVPGPNYKGYFFFSEKAGGLWKLVLTKVSHQSFAEFLVNLVQVYGPANAVEYGNAEKKTNPRRATWVDHRFVLEARARPDYSAITVSWSVRSVTDRIEALRKGTKPAGARRDAELDPTILDIMSD